MVINKYKWFLNILCFIFLICFATLSTTRMAYAQTGIAPENFFSSSSFSTLSAPSYNFSSFGATSFGAPAYGTTSFGATNYGATGFGMPAYGATGFSMPSYGATGFGMPAYGTTGFGATNYGATGFGMPAYGAAGFSMPAYGATGFGMPAYGATGFGMPAYGATGLGMPSYGAAGFGMPAYGAAGFGMPGLGASAFGMPGFGMPALGMPALGMPALGMPAFGMPAFGALSPYGYQQTSGGSRSSQSYSEPEYESGFYTEDELPNIKGHWSGKWEAFKTDKDGVVTDPNGQIIITQEGDLAFYIKSQKSSGGKLSGTIEIMGWNVDEYQNWEGEAETIELTGWLDEMNGWFNAHYFYFTGTELKSDYSNLISDFLWNFHNLEVNASETGIFGQFRIRGTVKTNKGTKDYELIGKFQAGKYVPD